MNSVQSIERALTLMEEAARQPGGLVDLARRADLPVSTTARILGTLEGAEAVTRSPDGSYRIGSLMRSMGKSLDLGTDLLTASEHHLSAMAADLDEAACISTVVGHDVLTVRQVDAPKPIQAEDWTGTRVPLHAGSAGFVIMATWPEAEVEAFLAGNLPALTDRTVVDPDALRSLINDVRRRRVIWTHGEYVEGLSSCAAAILNARGDAVGALYTYGPSYRFPQPDTASDVAAQVLDRADRISAELGYRAPEGGSR